MLISRIREPIRLNRTLPVDKQRVPWALFCGKISDNHSRKIFRMPVEASDELCRRVEDKVGADHFRKEACLTEKWPNHKDWTNQPISRETMIEFSI